MIHHCRFIIVDLPIIVKPAAGREKGGEPGLETDRRQAPTVVASVVILKILKDRPFFNSTVTLQTPQWHCLFAAYSAYSSPTLLSLANPAGNLLPGISM